jgi:hypothetical protein
MTLDVSDDQKPLQNQVRRVLAEKRLPGGVKA